SRVDEALRRAAAVPKLAAANGQLAERAAQRVNRSGLDHYPREERRPIGSTAGEEQTGGHAVVSMGQRPDVLVMPRFSDAYRAKLVIDASTSSASIEQYRRL